MTDQLVEPAESAVDALTALVAVTDEGLRGTQAGLGRVAAGLGAPLQVVVALPEGMALKGDQGDKGDKGDTGAAGATGPKGATGAAGAKGGKGDTGAIGATGSAGSNGSDGVGTDQLVKTGIDDPRAAFLSDKLEAGPGIRIRTKKSPTGNTLLINTTGQTGGGGTGGGSAGLIVYDDGVSVGVGNKVSYDGGDPVTISGGIIHVPVGSGGGADDQTAAEVPFTPAGTIAASNTQAAVEEVATDAASALSTHAAAGDPHPGYTTAAELATGLSDKADTGSAVMDGDAAGGDLSGTYPDPGVAASHSGSTHAATQAAAEATAASALTGHTADATAAHAASAVGFTPAGPLSSTDVQAAIEEAAATGGVTNPLTADLETGGFLIRGADVGAAEGGLIEAEDAEADQGGGITVTGGAASGGIGGNGTFEGGNGDQGGLAQLQGGHSFGAFDGGYANIEAGSANVDGQQGGNALVTGGSGSVAGTTGGDGILIGGVSQGSGVPARVKAEGMPAVSGNGVVVVTSDGVTFNLKQAAFVEPTTATPEQVCLVLIAAGLMAAS